MEYEFPFCLWILNRPTVISARSEDIAAVFNQPAALNRGGMIKKLGKPLFGNSLFIADCKYAIPKFPHARRGADAFQVKFPSG